jgi:DNA-binding transcriptional MocR family regulator
MSRVIHGTTAREIAESVESAIGHGELQPGDPLPSVRGLAGELGVSPMTVVTAFKDLRIRGLVTTSERRRTRVATRPPIARRSSIPLTGRLRDLAGDNPDPALLPAPRFKPDDQPRLYGGATVLPELADLAIAEFATVGVPAKEIAVLNGTFAAIERILQAHTKPGDRVAVEDPGYTGVIDLCRALGLRIVGVPTDEFGMLPDRLDAALSVGATAVLVTPRAQNPAGAAFDRRRAGELRTVLRAQPETLVVEDDHAGPIAEEVYHTLVGDRERWAVVRSVSKSLGPDLRLAVVTADSQTLTRVEGRQLLTCGWVSLLVQRLVVDLWQDNEVRSLLARAAATYTERRRALLEHLAARDIPAQGRSGLNVWLPVPTESTAIRNLVVLGWAVAAGEVFRIDTPPGLRITTAGLPVSDAEQLADDLARALRPERHTGRS